MTTGPQVAAAGRDSLTVDGVTVRLGGRTILDDVSFSVGEGDFTGLIGANGAGKTTLFRVILGLQATSGGSVRISQAPGAGREVGYVPQRFSLDPDLPVRGRDLVALGLDGQRLGIPLPSRTRRDLVDEMLDAVDAREFADGRVGELSGGEQQRVLIAHALISRPRLLLLDEPLANLDLRSAQEVVALLREISREQQIGILISAHEINPLLPAMDAIVYLAAGRAASGSVAEVVRSDVLSELYGHHVDVLRVHGRVIVVAGTGHDEHAPLEAADEAAAPAVEIV